MSSFDGSEEEEEFSPQQKSTRVSLRQRGGVNYNEKALYKLDEELEQELADSPLVKKSKKKNYKKIISQKYEGYDDDEDDEKDKNGSSVDENTDAATDANYGTSEVGGIFFPEIDQILFRREMKDQPGKMEYLVKYKDWSYLHVDWLEEKDVINETTSMKNKLNRFNKAFDRKIMEGEIDEETIAQERYFDPTYVEVDRIIHTTELFPVIHPKKSNEIKGKWTESLVLVVNKLLNFTKDTVHYGIHFQEPVNPERDGCPNYKKIITYPMDLGSLLNRLYLDFYKNQQNVWHDLGFVFKNARKYNKDPDSDIRILSDTLRECAVFLYREWYKAQKQKYEDLKHDYYMRTDPKYREEKQNQYITEFKKEFSKFTLEEIGGLKKIMKEFINQKQDETMEFQEQLDEFIQIYEEKPGFEAEGKATRKIYDESEYLSKLDLSYILQSLHIQNPLANKMNGKSDQNDKNSMETEEEEDEKNLKTELPKFSSEEEEKRDMEKRKEKYKHFVSKLNPEQKKQLQSELNDLFLKKQEEFQKQSASKKMDQQQQSLISATIKKQIQKLQLADANLRKLEKMVKSSENLSQHGQKGSQIIAGVNRPLKSLEEIEKFSPGAFSFQWLQEERYIPVEEEFAERFVFIGEAEFEQLNLNRELDRLYLVKWRNLSYQDSTWELESLIACPQKINDFKMYNRALDKESRNVMIANNQRHKTLLDLEMNPKKKAKLGFQAINELKNKLFFYDVSQKRGLKQYTKENQTIYKDRKLLRYYQLESLNWMIKSWYEKRNVILADEMGLGKTIQTMAFLNHLHVSENCRGPFLVIAPLSTLEHWKRTVDEWTNLNGVLYYDTGSQEGRNCLRYYEWLYTDISMKGTVLQTSEIYKFTVLITSNEVFMQDLEKILINIPFQFIVVDEAHRLKNQNAKILAGLKKMPCRRIMLLTGTPIQNNTEELFTLLNYIEPSRFNSVDDFKSKFGDLKSKDQVDKLQDMLKPYLLRRMKEDVEDSIPPLQETIIDIEMTTIQKALYRGIYEKNKQMLAKNFSSLATGTSLNNLEMQLRKCCSHPFLIKEIEQDIDQQCDTVDQRYQQLINQSGKMILLDKLITKFKSQGTKVLVFSQFTYMLTLIEEYLKTNRLKFEKIDGAVKARDRQNAIDRFNNPLKQRDVFLLSTKAGGLGINLTSANVVIIFDSDWNPQNDLQAIARAHRIGQTSEVMVYRFVTRGTYEAQMFERATIKLGLDQAIFFGGDFNNSESDRKALEQQRNQMGKKMDNKEVETLLKKGILGFVDENDERSKAFQEENIDDILINNTRQAKFSMINGKYNFNKQQFVSNQTDIGIDMNDPEFWNKVLKGRDSQAKLLQQEFQDHQKEILASLEKQKQFIWKLCDLVNELVESKLTSSNYSADDERYINDILNLIISTPKFNSKYQQLATNWLIECQRPTRRFKKLTLDDLQLNNLQSAINSMDKKKKMDEDDEDNFLEDDEELFSDNNIILPANIGKGGTAATNYKPVNPSGKLRASDDMLKKLCYYCERLNCTYICTGPCRRGFHENCKKEFEEKGCWVSETGPDRPDIPLLEEGQTEEELRKRINENDNFVCGDCKKNQAVCFICKKKGPFFGNSKNKKKKKQQQLGGKDENQKDNEQSDIEGDGEGEEQKEKENEDQKTNAEQSEQIEEEDQGGETQQQKDDRAGRNRDLIVKCSTANCNKFYHLSCTDKHQLFKYIDPPYNTRFRCSLHYCQKCSISGDSLTLAQCVRCQRSYHLKCFDKLNITKLGKKIMICNLHEIKEIDGIIPQLVAFDDGGKLLQQHQQKEQQLSKQSGKKTREKESPSKNKRKPEIDLDQISEDLMNEDIITDYIIKKKQKKENKEKENKEKEGAKDLEREKEKEKEKEKSKERDRHREHREHRHRDRDRDKDREYRSDRDRDRDRERDRDRDRERDREHRSDKKKKESRHHSRHHNHDEKEEKRKTRHGQQKLDSFFKEKRKKSSRSYSSSSSSSSQSSSSASASDQEKNNEKLIQNYLQNKKQQKEDNKKKDGNKKTTPQPSISSSSNLNNRDNTPKFTYEELNMTPPKDFDYFSYKLDWCRYCGARFSSNFTKGPWGPRTLCTVHYINIMQKKKIKISQHVNQKPETPINPEDQSELMYISREKTKNPDFNPGEQLKKMIEESKKQKEEEDLVQKIQEQSIDEEPVKKQEENQDQQLKQEEQSENIKTNEEQLQDPENNVNSQNKEQINKQNDKEAEPQEKIEEEQA